MTDSIARAAADIVAAFLARNDMKQEDVPVFCRRVAEALACGRRVDEGSAAGPIPAVDPSQSVENDYIICLEDGERLKMMKRHLRVKFGMSPEEYRRKWGLPPDYPMVAPAYARRRADIARQTSFVTSPTTGVC